METPSISLNEEQREPGSGDGRRWQGVWRLGIRDAISLLQMASIEGGGPTNMSARGYLYDQLAQLNQPIVMGKKGPTNVSGKRNTTT